jgi:3-deoxy-manno-octulosonate cytidylyltransferase (CMP-KDO synthetase)
LVRTVGNALKFADKDTVVAVATDAASIINHLDYSIIGADRQRFTIVPTERTHLNGTSRVLEAATKLGAKYKDVIVNLQGDMPVIDPAAIESCLKAQRGVKSAYYLSDVLYDGAIKFTNTNEVKVVASKAGYAHYFSREVIPYNAKTVKIHVGIYGYPFHRLKKIAGLTSPEGELENLEQLNWLMNNVNIQLKRVKPSISIDTQEDLERLADYDRQQKDIGNRKRTISS